MIVSSTADGYMLVRQVDHQDQCAAMAEAWGGGGFERLPRYDSLVAAARWHDEGWRSWEERPGVDADGRPLDFPDIDRATHVALYRAGIDEVCRRDPLAGLLVSMHGAGLYRGRLGLDHVVPSSADRPAAVDEFLDQEDARQATLRARLGHGPGDDSWSWAAYRLLQSWDLLSLALLWGRLAERRSITLPRVPRDAADTAGVDIVARPCGKWRAALSPWPFAGHVQQLPVRGRAIPPGPYPDGEALRVALADAPWVTLDAAVEPG